MAEYIEREALLKWALDSMDAQRDVVGKAYCAEFVRAIRQFKAADVAPVVHCKNCVYDKDCFIQKSLSIANIDNPYCCLGKRKARMDGE